MATATKDKAKTESTSRCNPRLVKVGSVFSRHSFGVVTEVSGNRVGLRNDKGFEWHVDANIIEQEFSFADQFDTEEEVSRTRAIEVMSEHSHTAMTIVFRKQPDAKAVADTLKAGQGSMSDKDWKKLVAAQVAGEERTMIGHHSNSYDEHRRLHFSESGVGPRLVDPRTIESLIVNRVKYAVK